MADETSTADLLVSVALGVPAADGVFTYRVPPELAEGAVAGRRVQVPIGHRAATGVVLGPAREPDGGKLRDVQRLLDDGPLLTAEVLELCRFAAQHYLYPLGPAVKAALPPGIDLQERGTAQLTEQGRALLEGPPQQEPVLPGLEASPRATAGAREAAGRTRLLLRRIERGEDLPAAQLRALERRGLLTLVAHEERARIEAPRIECARALPTAAERLGELHRAPRQRELVTWLLARERPVTVEELIAAFPGARPQLKLLVQRAFVELFHEAAGAAADHAQGAFGQAAHTATPAQAEALVHLRAALDARAFSPFLLHGVTGSGKTWVYLEAIAHARAAGLGALALVPEIALTPQLAGRFRARFGDDVAVLHSGLTDRERYGEWLRVREGRAGIVVGARSAVFAPVQQLGIVVVDEEHEPSYKQEERLRYHARDLSLVRAQRAGAVCVLGSATPSLETLRRANEGKVRVLSLPERAQARPMPAVEVVDLKDAMLAGALEDPHAAEAPRLVTTRLAAALRETVGRGEQAILFLNRRGHSRTLLCRSCGAAVGCPNCSVALVLHRRGGEKLKCHLCGHDEPPREACAACGGKHLFPLTAGTEGLEHELRELLPGARVARLDRDAAGGAGQAAAVLARFARREVDVLAGTQMVAKGHDFPGVTLVGVLDADGPLHQPDFRAGERCVQLLSQVAGRAGRGDRPGLVLLQAWKPDEPALLAAARHDYAGFAAEELTRREALAFPPYARLCAVYLSGNVEPRVQAAAQLVAGWARQQAGAEVLGPSPAPLSRVRGRHRWQLLLRAPEHGPLLRVARALVARFEQRGPAGVELVADVDPLSLA